MKLQISFDSIDLDKALETAQLVHQYADIIEIGSLLIYAHGIDAIQKFREAFPDKTLLADTKIVDRGKDAATLFIDQADWISVMAGTNKQVIHSACSTAHAKGKKVILDMIDSREFGQTALEAKNLGADALMVHQPYDVEEPLVFLDKWEMIRGNTDLPISILTRIKRDNIHEIMKVKPDGIILGRTITDAENPAEEAQFFYDLCKQAS